MVIVLFSLNSICIPYAVHGLSCLGQPVKHGISAARVSGLIPKLHMCAHNNALLNIALLEWRKSASSTQC